MIRKTTLENGLTLLTESMPAVRSVTIGVWLRQGSRSEPAPINGISHFIEHLVFKGTERRTAREIALAMDSVGGQMDAFTSKEYTCFYAKVLDEHAALAIDVLADIVQRPLFDPAEIERERQVVLEEIKMVWDTPDELIYDLFSEACYPHNTLGRPIQGTAASVSALSRPQLLRFFRGAYRPRNMLVTAAGSLEHARFARLVGRAFKGLLSGPAANGRVVRPRPAAAVLVKRRREELEQLHLLLGLPAYPEGFKRRFPLYTLNTLLGGTISSRLFQRIREERGLAYTVYSALNAFLDSGFLMVYAATGPGNGAEVVRLVVEELRSLRDRGPAEHEVMVAREHLKGSLMLSLESTTSRMSNLARHEIYLGRQESLADTLAAVDRVTPRQVHNLCRQLFGSRQLGLAAVGRVGRRGLSEEALRL